MVATCARPTHSQGSIELVETHTPTRTVPAAELERLERLAAAGRDLREAAGAFVDELAAADPELWVNAGALAALEGCAVAFDAADVPPARTPPPRRGL